MPLFTRIILPSTAPMRVLLAPFLIFIVINADNTHDMIPVMAMKTAISPLLEFTAMNNTMRAASIVNARTMKFMNHAIAIAFLRFAISCLKSDDAMFSLPFIQHYGKPDEGCCSHKCYPIIRFIIFLIKIMSECHFRCCASFIIVNFKHVAFMEIQCVRDYRTWEHLNRGVI